VPAEEIRSVLNTYAQAFQTKDITLLQKVRPGLKADEIRKIRDSFDQSREYRMTLKVESLDVSGDQAVVRGLRQDNLVSRSGQSFRNESAFTFRLKRTPEGWVIDATN
jgi:ketosteroid isomerase-like protein